MHLLGDSVKTTKRNYFIMEIKGQCHICIKYIVRMYTSYMDSREIFYCIAIFCYLLNKKHNIL